jgi:hypothetical protein
LVHFCSNPFGGYKKSKCEIGDIISYLPDPLVDEKSYNKKDELELTNILKACGTAIIIVYIDY